MLFAYTNFVCPMVIVGFGVLLNELVLAFNISAAWVIALLILPNLLYVPMTFVAIWLYDNMRTHHVVYITVALQLVGCWIRSLAFWFDSFWPIMVGTIIFVSSVPLCTNAISLIANQWFADDERGTATALISLSIPLGSLTSLVLDGVAANGLDETDPVACFNVIKIVTYVQNILITTFGLLTLLLFKEKPEYPPSKLALIKAEASNAGLANDLKVLWSNKNYLANLWVFTFTWGTYSVVGNLLTPLFGE